MIEYLGGVMNRVRLIGMVLIRVARDSLEELTRGLGESAQLGLCERPGLLDRHLHQVIQQHVIPHCSHSHSHSHCITSNKWEEYR